MSLRNKQQGFSLFIVLLLMVIIALLVIVTNQSSLTEMRLSSNEADRKVALSRAEYGLREAEEWIQEMANEDKEITFSETCAVVGDADSVGLCQPVKDSFDYSDTHKLFKYDATMDSTVVAWHRCADNAANDCSTGGNTVLDDAAHSRASTGGDARYIIEYLGTEQGLSSATTANFFRITSKATGNNADTKVLLQSYVKLSDD